MKKLISNNDRHRQSKENVYNPMTGAGDSTEMNRTSPNTDYHSTDYSENVLNSNTQKLKPPVNATSTGNKSSSYVESRHETRLGFYSSGMGLTFSQQHRAWVDPWEANPSKRFLSESNNNPELNDLKSNENIVSQIEPKNTYSPFQRTPNSREREMSVTGNAEEFPSMSYLYNPNTPIAPTTNGNVFNIPNFKPEMESKQSYEMIETQQLKRRGSKKIMKKFGAWDGVMAGCLLNIFGVIMFLRVGWIVGQCGILPTFGIILISTVVTTSTTLSMSAICTNGTILAGGAYYIISRTLGPAFGGSVGILLSFGSMVACSMYLTGFAETLVDNLKDGVIAWDFSITGQYVMDVRIWSNILLIIVLILALVGLNWVIKAQIGLLIFICFAILTFFIGSFYKTEDDILYGMDGWTNGNLKENLLPNYQDGYDFWMLFAIFFPAVTGIMAGANISGDLKNPSHDIPAGTLSAVGISTIAYMLMALFVGAVANRTELVDNVLIMADICVLDYIIFIGIYAATLSSAIAVLVGAPRILMAIAEDNIIAVPGITYFAQTDASGNPVRGYFLSFAVAFAFNCIGELNLIAPLISQFFIIIYLIINFASFVMEISHSP
eukprot:142503_1